MMNETKAPRVLGAFVLAVVGSMCLPAAPVMADKAPVELTLTNPFLSLTGTLGSDDDLLNSGEYCDKFVFFGRRGQKVVFGTGSRAFDTYLIMVGPNRFSAQNDDVAPGQTNSMMVVTLPEDGAYMVGVSSARRGETGNYELLYGLEPS